MLNMNRSSCASGSGYVPSCSIGFCVAMVKNGFGSLYVDCPAVTSRSCMACSSAACVLGGVRLISSASRILVKIGPSTNRNEHRPSASRSEEHTSELQSRQYLVCRLLLEKKKK